MSLSAADFELLLQANRVLSSKLDDQEVLEAVMELATKVVRAEASSLLLLDPATNELYFDVALGAAREKVKQIRLKVGEGVAGWVAAERVPLIVNDTSSDPRFTAKVDTSTSFKTKSILAVPLIARGALVGVVEAINKEREGAFTTQDQEAFALFANQAAIAIQNARLFSEVRREREKLSNVFDAMSDAVLLLDRDGRVLLANPACGRLLGSAGEQAVGKKLISDLLADFDAQPPIPEPPAFEQRITRIELKRRLGKDFYVGALVLRLDAAESGVKREGWLVILRDETEERREGLLKQNFLSLVSHKLKTPLTVIAGYAPMLLAKMENLNEFQKKAINAIAGQSNGLISLVDKLLRFTAIESETVSRQRKPASLKSIFEETLGGLEMFRLQQGANVHLSASIEAAPQVMVDPTLTVEVMKNLVENAIKFNDKPQKDVWIEASKDGTSVLIRIKDNGVGIPPEEREKIFQKFYQVEKHYTGQVPGVGLGLALSKKLVESMGGKISLESEIGKGTVLTVALPVNKTPSS